ncbi:carbonic anhydrase family protein [Flavobacteriaceae bacterium 14752]|uniref:carbonic anhydrase family protein n=1 Tax=Mesohalobacter salilacus TaxID=2491711 RepID=UPI000F63C12D|nr:carbonic anhydrase [Flavobacteriaceae bacterium 14752]
MDKIDKIISKQEQDKMTPESVLKDLIEGNKRFIENKFEYRDYSSQKISATEGQYPKAIVLSCVDSRVPVETIFDQGIGDIFVSRVAGNFVNTDILGSMEYACKVAGSKLVFVLGHEKCGAVSSACDHVELGNITSMLKNIKPAIEDTSTEGERSSKNAEFVQAVVEKNVQLNIERIRKESPILKDLEDFGEIKIVGGVYSLKTGKIKML